MPAPPGRSRAPLALTAIGLALVAGVGLAFYLTRDSGSDEEEWQGPTLPEPREPRRAPLMPPGRGFGWGWVNPVPRAMPTWNAIARGGDGHFIMVGPGGQAARYDGSEITRVASGTDATLRGVDWIDSGRALAAGEGGALIVIGGESPRAIEGAPEVVLRAVAAADDGRAWVAGDGGTLLEVTLDEAPQVVETGTDRALLALARRGRRLFAVGASGVALRYEDGAITAEVTGTRANLRAIGGCGAGLYAAGDAGVLLRRRASGEYEHLHVPRSVNFTGVACDRGRVVVVGGEGAVLLVSGARAIELPSGTEEGFTAVGGLPEEGGSWIVGVGGRLASVEVDHIRVRTGGPVAPLRALGSMGGSLMGVGEWGRIIRQGERGLSEVESPTESGLSALIQLEEGRLLAVGDFGALVDIRHDRATLLSSPTRRSLRDGIAEAGQLLIVGAEGTYLYGRLGELREARISDLGDLWSVVGAPDDAIAVGAGGVVLRIRGASFARISCPAGDDLFAVAQTPDGRFAVGAGGRILRLGAECVEERRGGPDLRAVGVGPDGRPLAVGDRGTLMTRAEDGTWRAESIDVAGHGLRTLWRDARNVFVAGAGGVVIRHVRLD